MDSSDSKHSSGAAVVIGIPTYRRPADLGSLLATLRADLDRSETARDRGVFVIVADNASDAVTRKIADRHLGDIPHVVLGVTTPGVSAVRNALVREAARHCPGYEWLVMLDDDGLVNEPWLDPLLRTAARLNADMIAGPVLGDLPAGASRVAQNSLYGGRQRFPSGPVGMLNGAQNLAVHRRVWEAMPRPWFDPSLGRSGGEDYELFRHAKALGFTLAWCDEATVDEPTPPERLTTTAICRRIFNSNRTGARIDHAYDGLEPAVRRAAVTWVWAAKSAVRGVLSRDVDRLVVAGLHVVCAAGRALGVYEGAAGRGPRLARNDATIRRTPEAVRGTAPVEA